jgi:hypothetical protein
MLDSAPSWSINHVHTVGKAFSGKEFLLARAAVPASPLVHRVPSPLYCVARVSGTGASHPTERHRPNKTRKIRFLFTAFFLFQSNSEAPHHELVEWFSRKLPPASLSRVPRSLPGTRAPSHGVEAFDSRRPLPRLGPGESRAIPALHMVVTGKRGAAVS